MRFFTDDKTVQSPVRVPDHLCGWSNLVHGGVISTICDEIMSWTALHLLRRIILTRTMTIDFIKPLFVGQDLRAEGQVIELVSDREARIEGRIFNHSGDLCARSQGTFALFTIEAIRRLNIIDPADLDAMEAIANEKV